jgi:hypothetical protein
MQINPLLRKTKIKKVGFGEELLNFVVLKIYG